eukprot:TRINITY_DN1320_c0_g1_i1.p1 TRINITY_DN1320_c0_g1~~TRINITY_DN1320_c0_g1_i1.p1  ORF type:complete len:383 (-),score=81.47 TRINITY_DN1320_c0_g1_i1:4-1152(-)
MDKNDMIYRYLGKSGLKVSVLGYGNWVNNKDCEEPTYECMKKAFEGGINFFDTAEIYGYYHKNWGVAETIMGNCLKRLAIPRKDFVLSTKFYRCGEGENDCFLSRKHLVEGIKNSLKRLQVDYVDVVFAHRYDSETPIEEVCRAFNWIIEQGYAFYWGTSMWTPQQIMEANERCERLKLIKPIVDQCEYNMLKRENMEFNLPPIYDKCGYGTTIWSPLASGILTGKYNDGKKPEDSRFGEKFKKDFPGLNDMIWPGFFGKTEEENKKTTEKLQKLGELAKSLDVSQAQLALAWAIANTDVSTAIIGASKPSQVEDNLKAVALLKKWTPELEAKIEEILGNQPKPPLNWRTWAPMPERRTLSVKFEEKKQLLKLTSQIILISC